MTPRQRLLVFTAAGFSALFGIGAFAFFVYHTIQNTHSGAATPAEDRKLVITAASLAPHGIEPVDPQHENFTSQRTFDGTTTIEYSYSSSNDPDSEQQLYLMSNTYVFAQTFSTIQMFKMQQLTFKGGMSVAGSTVLVPAPHLLTGGDARYAAILKRKDNGAPAGNLFLIRQGRVMHSVILTGVVLDDAAEVRELLRPVLEESKRRFLKR